MYENPFRNPTALRLMFVYGTLKRGEPNHSLLTSPENGSARFVGVARTVEKFPLIIATRHNIPFLLKRPGIGHQVDGEVYEVDNQMLKKMDELEDHPDFYVREEDEVLLAPKTDVDAINGDNFEQVAKKTKAWVYFLPKFRESLLELPMLRSYSNHGDHGLKYVERYLRTHIMNYDYRLDVREGDYAKPSDLC